jgi:hypothetical protein
MSWIEILLLGVNTETLGQVAKIYGDASCAIERSAGRSGSTKLVHNFSWTFAPRTLT